MTAANPASEVTFVGLGAMGSALARAAVRAGKTVTVWNRSPGAAAAFAGHATIAGSIEAAVRSSPLTVTCLSDYGTTRSVLEPAWPGLAGRTLCCLSSGAPAEARSLSTSAAGRDVRYLDGAIASYPARIGAPTTAIFYSGDADAFRDNQPLLAALAGAGRYVGADPGAAAVCDQGWLAVLGGFLVGILHGAAQCDSENVPAGVIFEAVPAFVQEFTALAVEIAPMVAARRYEGDQAALSLYLPAFEFLETSAADSGISTALPELLRTMVAAGMARGLGHLEFAALFELIRQEPADEAGTAAGGQTAGGR